MKRICVLAAAAVLFLVGCSTSTTAPAPASTAEAPAQAEPVRQKDPNATYTKVSFEVPTMSCPHACWPKVKKTLEAQPGVGDVTLAPQKEADLIDQPIVYVEVTDQFQADAAIAALSKVGFDGAKSKD